MINLTIYKAYIPYDDGCTVNNIQIIQGPRAMNNVSIVLEKCCGHLFNETVYVNYHKAVLRFEYNTPTLTLLNVHIKAVYQVLYPGSAFKFTKPCVPLIPPTWKTNVLPSLHIFMGTQFEYIWYLSSSVQKKIPVWNYHQLTVSSLICSTKDTSLLVFPGLLPRVWTFGKVKQPARFSCNVTEMIVLDISMCILQWY